MNTTSILIVEDSGIVLLDIQRNLKLLGYTIAGTASTKEEAIQKAQESRPGLVLMDIRLGDEMGGIEAADYIRIHFDIPIIFLTGYADEDTFQRAKITDPFGYILKPFDPKSLRTTIEMALHKHGLEKQLCASELRYRHLIESIEGIVWEASIEPSGFTYISPKMKVILGYDPESWLGSLDGWVQAIHPEDREGAVNFCMQQTQAGEDHTFEYRITTSSGEIKWLRDIVSLVWEKDKVVALRGIMVDVTSRTLAEQAVQESEERYRLVADYTYNWEFWLDPQGRVIYNSPSCELVTGYQVGDFKTRDDFAQIITPDDRLLFDHLLENKPGDVHMTEFRIVTKSGDERIIEHICQPVFSQTGQFLGRRGSNRDITNRKQTEQKLRENEARYRSLFEQSHDAVFIIDMEGRHISANQRAANILGYNVEEIQKMTVQDTSYEPEGSEQIREKLLRGEHIPLYERNFRKKDGSVVHTEINVELVKDDQGNPLHIQSVVRDITERKKAEAKLRKNEYLLHESQKIAGLGHYDLDLTTGFWESSETLNKLFGIDGGYCNDVAGWLKIVHPNDREMMETYFANGVLGERLPFDREYRILRVSDGKTRWVHGQGKLEFDIDGKPIRMIGSIQDITERKQAESIMQARLRLMEFAASHSLEALLQKTLDEAEGLTDSSIGFYHFLLPDQNTISLQSWSTRTKTEFCTALGKGLHYSIDKAGVWVDCIRTRGPIIHNDYASLTHRKGLPEGHAEVQRELVVPVKRGENIVSILGVGNKPQEYTDDDIHTVSLLADLAWDIAERKRAEDALREREEKLQSIFRAAPVGIGMVINRIIQEANQTLCHITGYTHEELIGKDSRFLYPTLEEYEFVGREKYQQINSHGLGTVETRWVRKDGNTSDILLSSVPIDGNDLSKGVTFTALDITERKRIEESVRMKTEELEVLFSISTHLRLAQTANEMIPVVLAELRRVLESDASAIILYSPEEESFTYALGDGILASNIGKQFSVENSISGLVLKTRQPYISEDLSIDTNKAKTVNGADNLGPAVLVPVQSDVEFLGILVCSREKNRGASPFSPSEVQLLTAIGEMVGNALRRARLFDQALSRLQHVQALHSVDMAISANLDLNITLEILLSQVTAQLNVDAADILLLDPYSYVLEFAAGHGFRNKHVQANSLRIGEGLAGWVALNRKMLTVPDLALSDRWTRKNLLDEGLVSYYGVPLISKGNLLGVFEIFSRSSLPVSAEQLDYLEALAIQAAIAIDNAKLFAQLQTSNLELSLAYDATIEGWSRALELRDEETEGHTLRVTDMTMRLAKAMGFNDREFTHIRHGALLHDIGKMGIPDKILLKPGELNEEEWEIMKKHTVYAFEMLWPINFLRPAIDIPHCHHEKWDGTGYPRHLTGEAIPLAARIFAVADVYDALTSDRPYRKAWTKEKAVKYILGQSGLHFQPEVVEAFVKIVAMD